MKPKDRKKSKKIKYILIIVILIFIIFLIFRKNRIDFMDDFIFFKLFSDSNVNSSDLSQRSLNQNKVENLSKTNTNYPIYEFNVSYKNTKFEGVDLLDTVDNETLIREKVAPGTKGKFKIRINSNEDMYYEVDFNSLNEKPKNLIFIYNNNKYQTLDELEGVLVGKIGKKETIDINIFWEWEYRIDTQEDIQDTEDGEKLLKYNFTIETIGRK